ncbi:MAG: sulfatase-like hydrolase/transferase [Proteobacteria bacterium]|nr:sulfatase-like hydrolase/transferase [Pseudomonadota bacterium]
MKMIWTAFIIFTVFGMVSCKCTEKPPSYNVVLISIDTLRADHLNCYGYDKRVVSPNIDALARDGILFENFITSSPWTTPAHLSMLTSLGPSTHGMNLSFQGILYRLREANRFSRMPLSKVTLAETLKNKGYVTGAFTGGGPVDPRLGFVQGFDVYDTSMFKLNKRNMWNMHLWLEQNANRKFFLFWHHFEMHAPYLHGDFLSEVLPPRTAEALQRELKHIAILPEDKLWPAGAADLRNKELKVLYKYNAYNKDVCEAMYAGCVLAADRWIGIVTKAFIKEGLYDRTMFIVTSDHGEEFGDHHPNSFYNIHGHTLYEEMVHVPLIIKLPNQKYAGKRVSDVTRIVDIMPTILDVLSIKPENDEMQGISMRPLWEKSSKAPSRNAFSEALTTPVEKKSIRTDRYKYILSVDWNTVIMNGRSHVPDEPLLQELYDLHEDPLEENNLLLSEFSEDAEKLAEDFVKKIQDYVPDHGGKTETIELEPETVERLKSLGYIDM